MDPACAIFVIDLGSYRSAKKAPEFPQGKQSSAEEIVERCIGVMINEAARCLEEGIVASADDVDRAMVMGTGFAPFRGGLMRHADSLGAAKVVETLERLETEVGPRFAPAKLLLTMAKDGRKFTG